MTEREATGIAALDDLLEGGFPKGSTVILIGEPGSGKSIFCNQFMQEGLATDQGGLFIALDDAPDDVVDTATDVGWTFKESANFAFMDAYSWRLGEDDAASKYAIQGPSDLNEINMTLTDALRDIGTDIEKRIVIDSVSTLVLYTDVSSAVKFLQVVSAKAKASNGVLLMTIEEGVHDEKEISTLNYVADGVIKLKQEGEKRMISVSRMAKTEHSRDWHEFEITDEGIKLQ